MKRISSSATSAIRISGLAACLGFLVLAYFAYTVSIIPCAVALCGAGATAVVWWKFVRRASHVFMDKEALYIKRGSTLEPIPLLKVLCVKRPRFVRNPPLIITYEKEDGSREELILIPTVLAS